jgi:hypothetical protein
MLYLSSLIHKQILILIVYAKLYVKEGVQSYKLQVVKNLEMLSWKKWQKFLKMRYGLK